MKHIEGSFSGFGGLNLYYQSWHPDNNVSHPINGETADKEIADQKTQAIVVMVHGLGGHSSLFLPAVEYLVPQGYEVYSFDLRGHGRSPGQRGYITQWAEFREDLHLFLQHVCKQNADRPCFLWGHSLGGTIALDYALRFPDFLEGLIVTAPALGKVQIPPFKLALGYVLSRIVPRFSLKVGLRNDLCLKNPDLCVAYLQDPLRHEYGSARLATEFFATVNWIYQHISDLKLPLLLLHCREDEVALAEASRDFFKQVIFLDKEHREYSGCYHDLYIDANYQVLADLNHWLERHIEGDDQSLTPCPS
jgi:alpha-beta hydrolase superfamily lysophospholipase